MTELEKMQIKGACAVMKRKVLFVELIGCCIGSCIGQIIAYIVFRR